MEFEAGDAVIEREGRPGPPSVYITCLDKPFQAGAAPWE